MSEFNRWLSRRNPRYFVEQEGAPVPPAPAEDAFEAAKKRRAELKKIRDAAAGQPQPPMGQNPPAPVEDAFELAKKRRAELKRQRDDAAKQQPPMGQQPPQPPVGDFKGFINKPAAENKQGGTSQPPTMQPPPPPPAAQKPTQTQDNDETTDEEIKNTEFYRLHYLEENPEKLFSIYTKKIDFEGGLDKVLKRNINIYWIAYSQLYKLKGKEIITLGKAKELLSTRKDLTGDTRLYLRLIAQDHSRPSDDDIKETNIQNLVDEYGRDTEELYDVITKKIQLQGFDEAVKTEMDAWHIFNRQEGIFQNLKKAKMIITPKIAQGLLKRIQFDDLGFRNQLRKFVRSDSSQQQGGM